MWAILLRTVILPELARILEARWQANQPPPTLVELEALLDLTAARIIAEGEAFLATATGPAPPPPEPPSPPEPAPLPGPVLTPVGPTP